MIGSISFLTLVAAAWCAPYIPVVQHGQTMYTGPAAVAVPVGVATRTKYHAQDELGQYRYGYTNEDGQYKEEVRGADGTVVGRYGYLDPTGQHIDTQYVADAGGFKASGAHIPTSAQLPTVVLSGPQPLAAQQFVEQPQFVAQQHQFVAQQPQFAAQQPQFFSQQQPFMHQHPQKVNQQQAPPQPNNHFAPNVHVLHVNHPAGAGPVFVQSQQPENTGSSTDAPETQPENQQNFALKTSHQFVSLGSPVSYQMPTYQYAMPQFQSYVAPQYQSYMTPQYQSYIGTQYHAYPAYYQANGQPQFMQVAHQPQSAGSDQQFQPAASEQQFQPAASEPQGAETTVEEQPAANDSNQGEPRVEENFF